MLMNPLTLGDIDSQLVKEKAKKISETIKSPLIIEEDNIEKILKSKKVPIKDKLDIVEKRVHQVLGKYKDNTLVIRNKEEFHQYISDSIKNNFISIDTETNNSLDPLTCKLMGLCIHTYNHKQAYIPVNHVNLDTGEKLPNQLTEQDIKEELSRLGNTKVIMHNGKFDYKVIKCTSDIALNVYWDTMLGARLEDENAKAGLKQQYVEKIDPEDEKYSIEGLFAGLEYAVVPPELFALYAATDAYKTTRLYDYQLEWFNKPENNKLLEVLREIEMPILTISAEMELRGICLDFEYGKRLSEKYHKLLDVVDKEIDKVLIELKPVIDAWKESAEGQVRVKKKTKAQQLSDPISLTSPTQLAILFYDILKVGVIDKENPRGTGADIIEKIYEKTKNPLCKLIIDKRGLIKLLNTYIDKLPESVNPSDHRLHGEFNQMGTDCITGDSSILTPDGVEFMGDIVGECVDKEYKEFRYPLINEEGVSESTSHKIMFKNAPTYKIKTIYGFELEGTPNHLIRVSDKNLEDFPPQKRSKNSNYSDTIWENYKWEKLENIKRNDLIFISVKKINFNQDYIKTNFDQNIQNITHKKSTKMPEYFDEKFAELLGMYHADGSLNTGAGSCTLRLHNEQVEVVERWKYLCEHCFDMKPAYEKQGPKSRGVISNWYINGKKLNQLFKYIHNGKTEKRIPKEILKSKDSVFNAYIRGLTLDSNTHMPKNDRLKITIFNKQDAQACQLRFLAQGVLTSLVKSNIKNGYEYGIQFNYDSLTWFYDNVGVIQSRKIVNPRKLKIKQQIYRKDDLIAIPVKNVIRGINTVYDFTLPETHSFISNGFISHNTGRFSSNNPNL